MVEINITNFEELYHHVDKWFKEDYLPNHTKEDLTLDVAYVHYMEAFLDAMEGYVIPNLEDEFEVEVENGTFNPRHNFLFRFFNEGHTLHDLACEVLQLHHLDDLDPYGLYSFANTWEVAIIAVQEFYKEVK